MSNRQEKAVHLSESSERKRKASDIKNLGTELFYSEEKSILDGDVDRDVRSHHAILDSLASIVQQVNRIKSSNNDQDAEALDRLRMEGMVNFAALKKMNRLGHLRSKRVRELTQEAKQQIDEYHLQLQNLLYEILHLQREIHKCLQFKSKHETISLVSEQEYTQNQHSKIKDEHKLMLVRMDWELKERIKLSEQLEECQRRRKQVASNIASKKTYLRSLQPKLSAILSASKPLQEDLDLRLSDEREQLSVVPHLPPALHLLFIQASSLARYVRGVSVEIVGDRELVDDSEEAFTWQESDSEDEGEKKGKHHRRAEDKVAKKRQEVFKMHPLALVISSSLPDAGSFQLTFHHFTHLHFVSVAFKFTPSLGQIPPSHHLFTPLSFISNLFPNKDSDDDEEDDDDGGVSPNTLNSYVLNKLGIDDLTPHLSEQVGRPFKWAQALCAVDVLMSQELGVGVKRGGVEGVVKVVGERVANRLVLYHTISTLGNDELAWQQLSGQENRDVQCSLGHWSSVNEEDFLRTSQDRPASRHFLYSGTLKHPSQQHPLSFTCSIPHSYPTHPCIFTLQLPSVHETLTASNNQAIRELECMVNNPPPLPASSLLPSQLTSLCRGLQALLQPTTHTRGPIRSLVIN